MPLIHKASKKAFEKNVKTEMEANPDKKDRAQNLAIAYSVQRKAKSKKMAEGGEVTISAANEKRPMPDDVHGDSANVSRNSNRKGLGPSDWTDNPTIKQAQKPSKTPLSQPRMVEDSPLRRRLHTQENDLLDSAAPASPKDRPQDDYNEMEARRQGPNGPQRGLPHSTKKPPYQMEVEHDDSEDQAEADMYAKGGEIEPNDYESWNVKRRTSMEPADLEIENKERSEQNDHQELDSPSEDEGRSHAMADNEEDPSRQGNDVPDMEDQHNSGRKPYYMGGPAVKKDHPHEMFDNAEGNKDSEMEMSPTKGRSANDSEDQPDSPRDNDYWNDNGDEDSIAAAIMAKRKAVNPHVGSGIEDMDEAAAYAEGGEVDLSINHDEEPNNEDQMSFEALEKENYNSSNLDSEQPEDSNLMGDNEEDDSENSHDMVSEIQRRMKARRQFSQR